MDPEPTTSIVLFSGLAADASVFVGQKLAFPDLVVPQWPSPLRNETLDAYCQRMAADLKGAGNQVEEKLIIGGASFGGIVALHMAKFLKPRAVILIGSVRRPAELPWIAKIARPLGPLIWIIPVRLMQLCCAPLASKSARRFFPHLRGLAWQFRRCDPQVFRWSLARILDWSETPEVACPVFHIHGEKDIVMPVRRTKPDETLPGGGHVISITHPSEVNRFIQSVVQQANS